MYICMSSHDAGAALLLASAPRLLLATFLLAGVASWLLQRPAGSSGGGSGRTHQPVAAADFFGRIRERLNHQAAPGGAEGGFEWTQTSDEVELAVPLEAHVRARDVDFHILPTSVALRIKGAASPLLEVGFASAARASTRPRRHCATALLLCAVAGQATPQGEERRVLLGHRCRRRRHPHASCPPRRRGGVGPGKPASPGLRAAPRRWRGRSAVAEAHAGQADAHQGELALDERARGGAGAARLLEGRPRKCEWPGGSARLSCTV